MQPIGYRLRLESRQTKPKLSVLTKTPKLSELDEEIARLEQLLHDNDEDSDNDNYDNSLIEIDDDLLIEKDDDGNIIRISSSNIKEADLIEKLPKQLLPIPMNKRPFAREREARKPKIRFSDQNDDDSQPIKQLKIAYDAPSTMKSQVKEYASSYEASSNQRRPFYCRVCQYAGTDEADFLSHKQSSSHYNAEEVDRKASFCKLCRKQFTSPDQLNEHLKGSAHREKLAYATNPRGRFS